MKTITKCIPAALAINLLIADGYVKVAKVGQVVTVGYDLGAVADASILGQFLAGSLTGKLVPIGDPIPFSEGRIFSRVMDIPFASPGQTVFVSFAAWDSSLWGLNYSGVPGGALARAGTVSAFADIQNSEVYTLLPFPEKMVIPTAVPEPSISMLGGVALGILALFGLSTIRKRRGGRFVCW